MVAEITIRVNHVRVNHVYVYPVVAEHVDHVDVGHATNFPQGFERVLWCGIYARVSILLHGFVRKLDNFGHIIF